MKARLSAAIIALAMIFPPVGTLAQEPDPGDVDSAQITDRRVEFTEGDNIYMLDIDVAINACIEGRDQTIDRSFVTLRVFARTTEPGQFEGLGSFVTEDTHDLQNKPIGYCLAMEGK